MLAHSRILQLDVKGSFDFYTQIVSLDAVVTAECDELMRDITSDRLDQPLTLEAFQRREKLLPLFAHEFTHFVDCSATLWGLRHLSLLDRAYRAMVSGREENFHVLKALHDHIRTLRLPAYYTLQGSATEAARPWGYRISLGRRFSAAGHVDGSTAITFCRFTTATGELLVRSPLSPVSLLETSAMAQELFVRTTLHDRLAPMDRMIESGEFSRRTMAYLYDRDLTEYSVCAHLLANYQNCRDALSTFMLSGAIARWVLNAPDRAYAHVAARAPLGRLLGVIDSDPFVTTFRDGIQSGDLGAMYFAMIAALPADAWKQATNTQPVMDAAMATLTLSPATVADWRTREVDAVAAELSRSPSRAIRRLAASGVRNMAQLTPYMVALPFAQLDLPQALLGDFRYRHVLGNSSLSMATVDPEEAFHELHSLERHVTNFAEACV